MYFIGIDLGTSAVKLLLMQSGGKIIRTVSESYPVNFPQTGWSEQNPEDWFDGTIKGLSKLLEGIDGNEVAGISFGGQMHGLTLLDSEGKVIRPAILWNDGRLIFPSTQAILLSQASQLRRLCGYIRTSPRISLRSLRSFFLRIISHTDFQAFSLQTYLMLQARSISTARTESGLMRCSRSWDMKAEWLPEVFESYEAIGKILPEIAEKTGISKDCVIAAGAGDNAAAAVGMGIIGNGGCNISLGTSGTIFIASDSFKNDEANSLHAFDHADGGFHLMGCMLSAASCNKWWMEEIIGTTDFAKEQEGLEALGTNKVFFLPYLMGERSPLNNPDCRAMFVGIFYLRRRC